ncbi:MAG: hypothetical protein JWM72_1540 [Actinomycetia bacterium]|nr:hypothetical protein [Actinomycetes bacterium]
MKLNSRRVALGTFIGVEAASLVFFVRIGRFAWFSQDEWDFLAARQAGDLGDLFRPHNEHWSTLPILAFRLLWQLFGLRTYVPYLVLVVTLHLLVAALLRMVMRRAGVGPWFATAGATAFALFGSGWFNIEYSFQSAWCATLALGLGYLMLVDHSGPVDRRDWIGLGLGLAALMCSGVATTMIVVVGVAVLVRRGWRPALLHAGTLGAIYVFWFATVGHQAYTRRASLSEAFRFTARELSGTFGAIGHLWGVGAALFIMLCIGLTLAWHSLRGAELRERAAVPAALLFGAVTFVFVTGLGRGADFAMGTPPGPASRYRYVAAVLILPALAVAAVALSRRSKVLAPIALALLLVGVPGNVRVAADNAPDWRVYKQLILSAPRLPILAAAPRSVEPDRFGNQWLTLGWMRDGIASGRIPKPAVLTPANVATYSLYFALQAAPPRREYPCVTLHRAVIRVLTAGRTLALKSAVSVRYVPVGGVASSARLLQPGNYTAVAGPLRLRLSPASPRDTPVVCG